MINTDVNTTQNISINKTRKFGLLDKLGYMFGDFGNDFFFMFTSSFLMVFYTDIFGISPTITGVLFLIARFWDAIMDVIVGRLIDASPSSNKGKFRPWIIHFSPILLIFGILLFTKIPGLSNQLYIVYAFATYIIWGSLYSTVNIPYGSMASVITTDPIERASLSTFRGIGAGLANFMIATIVPMFVFIDNKPDSKRFFIMAIIIAVCAMICYTFCYMLSIERIHINIDNSKKVNLLKSLKALTKNKPFLSIVGASLALIMAMLLTGSFNNYLYKDYFQNTKALSLSGAMTIFNIILVAPSVSPLSKKFGKKESACSALLVSAIGYFILFLFPIKNAYIFVVLSFIASIGQNYFNFMLWAFVTDVIDYQEYRTEIREDGTIYSIYSFIRKAGQALAGVIGGIALSSAGYITNAQEQSAEVVANIRNYATLLPAICYLVVFLVLRFTYPMTKEALTEIQAELSRRRNNI